jgi:hypothetical protein
MRENHRVDGVIVIRQDLAQNYSNLCERFLSAFGAAAIHKSERVVGIHKQRAIALARIHENDLEFWHAGSLA